MADDQEWKNTYLDRLRLSRKYGITLSEAGSILDAEVLQARSGIRESADQIQLSMFLDRDDEQGFDPEQFVNDIIGS